MASASESGSSRKSARGKLNFSAAERISSFTEDICLNASHSLLPNQKRLFVLFVRSRNLITIAIEEPDKSASDFFEGCQAGPSGNFAPDDPEPAVRHQEQRCLALQVDRERLEVFWKLPWPRVHESGLLPFPIVLPGQD